MADADVLSVRFTADLSGLNRASAEADRTLASFETSAQKRAENVGSGFDRLGSMIERSLKRAAQGATTFLLLQATAKYAKDAADLELLAGAADLTADRYQKLSFAFRAFGASAQDSANWLASFGNKVQDFRFKQGDLYEFTKKQAPALFEQISATKSASEAFDVVAAAVARMDTNENAALLTRKAFGDGTTALTKALRENATSFDKINEATAKFGGTISDEAISKARTLTTEFSALGSWFGNVFTTGMLAVSDTARDALAAFERFQNTVDANSRRQRGEGPSRVGSFATPGLTAPGPSGWQTSVAETIQEKPNYQAMDELARLRSALAGARNDSLQTIRLEAAQQTESARRLLEDRVLSEKEYGTARSLIAQTADAKILQLRRNTEVELKGLERQAAEAGHEHFRAIGLDYEIDLRKYQELLDRKLISTEQFEKARDNLNAVMSQKIKQRIDEDAQAVRDKIAPLEQAISGTLGNAMSEAFNTGQFSATNFFRSLSANVATAVAQMLVLKPIMDSLFSGKPGSAGYGIASAFNLLPQRAEGGAMMAGVPYLVGERGRPEVFTPGVSGYMTPAERFAGGAANSNGPTYNIDARYSDAGVEQRILSALTAAERSRPSAVSSARAYAKRFPMRA